MPRFFKKCSETFQKRLGTISKMFRNISKIVPQYFQKSSGTFLYCSRTLRQFSKVFLFQKCSGNISKVFRNILKSVLEHSKLFRIIFKSVFRNIVTSVSEYCSGTLRRFSKSVPEYFQKCSETIHKVSEHFFSVPERFQKCS